MGSKNKGLPYDFFCVDELLELGCCFVLVVGPLVLVFVVAEARGGVCGSKSLKNNL